MNIEKQKMVDITKGIYPVTRPCKLCEKRRQGCHSECLKYKMWLKSPYREKKKKHDKYSATEQAKRSGIAQQQRENTKRKEDEIYYFMYNSNGRWVD